MALPYRRRSSLPRPPYPAEERIWHPSNGVWCKLFASRTPRVRARKGRVQQEEGASNVAELFTSILTESTQSKLFVARPWVGWPENQPKTKPDVVGRAPPCQPWHTPPDTVPNRVADTMEYRDATWWLRENRSKTLVSNYHESMFLQPAVDASEVSGRFKFTYVGPEPPFPGV